MILHKKYQSNRPCGSREEEFERLSNIQPYKTDKPPGCGHFWPRGHDLNKFGRGPVDDTIYKI